MDPIFETFPRATGDGGLHAAVTEYRIFAFTKAEQRPFVAEIRDRGYKFTLSREFRNGTLVITSASPMVGRAIRRVARERNVGYSKSDLYLTPIDDDLLEDFHMDHLEGLVGDGSF